MKKILICLAALGFVGCGNGFPKTTESVTITKTNYGGSINDILVCHFEYDSHEYIAFKQKNGWVCGIEHSPKCPCKMK